MHDTFDIPRASTLQRGHVKMTRRAYPTPSSLPIQSEQYLCTFPHSPHHLPLYVDLYRVCPTTKTAKSGRSKSMLLRRAPLFPPVEQAPIHPLDGPYPEPNKETKQ